MVTTVQLGARRPNVDLQARGWLVLYPAEPGFFARVSLIAYFVIDRALNASRVSELVIRDVSEVDDYARFQIWSVIGLTALICISLLSNLGKNVWKTLFGTSLVWALLYLVMAAFSAGWSGSGLLTLFKATQCITFLFIVQLAIAGLPDLESRIKYLIVIALAYLLISYLTFLLYTVPDYGINVQSLHFVVGTTPFFMLIFLVTIPELWKLGKWFNIFFIAFILIETIFTAYMAIMVGTISNFVLKSKSLSRFAGLIIIFAAIGSFIMFLPSDQNASVFGVKKVADILEGSGRFEVWQYAVLDAFPEAPVIGHGFVVGDTVAREAGFTAALGQLHNSFLSALLNLGLVGLVLWLAFLIGCYRMMLRHPRPEVRRAFICAMICVFFQQISGGASLSSILHIVWVGHAIFFTIIALEDLKYHPRMPTSYAHQ